MHTAINGYEILRNVLRSCADQAENGKGRERHGEGGSDFLDQPIFTITKSVGIGFPLGQAMKKLSETPTILSLRGKEAAIDEIRGAIVYAAAAIMALDADDNTSTSTSINITSTNDAMAYVTAIAKEISNEDSF